MLTSYKEVTVQFDHAIPTAKACNSQMVIYGDFIMKTCMGC